MCKDDHVITVLVTDSYDHVTVHLDIIPAETMGAALQLIAPCMRSLMHTYALICARLAMVLKHVLEQSIDARLRAYRAYNKRHTGVAWPLPVCVHPVMKLDAYDVFVMTIMEFVS
jgi:hypothetical protein